MLSLLFIVHRHKSRKIQKGAKCLKLGASLLTPWRSAINLTAIGRSLREMDREPALYIKGIYIYIYIYGII